MGKELDHLNTGEGGLRLSGTGLRHPGFRIIKSASSWVNGVDA
jgi:hypothetical protein